MVIMLPLFFFLLFGIAEISRLWHIRNIVTTAARDGARVGASTTTALGEARIDEILASANLETGALRTVTCEAPCGPDTCGLGSNAPCKVEATVTVTFQTLIPFLADFVPVLGAPIPIEAKTIMRRE
jgi:Flp pilus assembly protein TadG